MTIGEKIRVARKDRKLTQKQLAEISGVIETTIRKYEAGTQNPKFDNLQKIATALGLNINAFAGSDVPTPKMALFDLLETIGYKISLYEEEDYRVLVLRNLTTGESYTIEDADLEELERNISSYSKFQIAELIKKLSHPNKPTPQKEA